MKTRAAALLKKALTVEQLSELEDQGYFTVVYGKEEYRIYRKCTWAYFASCSDPDCHSRPHIIRYNCWPGDRFFNAIKLGDEERMIWAKLHIENYGPYGCQDWIKRWP